MTAATVLSRLFGPPGTGKTTRLAASTKATVADRGPDSIAIASFSVTAAEEIASRDGVRGVLPDRAVGTLHSHAFRAIEHPDVALDPKVIEDWNASVRPDWRVSGDGRRSGSSDRAVGGGGLDDPRTGDELLAALGVLRARQAPGADWPLAVRAFAKAWTAWKRERECVDYEDMIVQAIRRARAGEPMSGNPEVLVVDEAQDMTPIECALAFAWGKQLAGDRPRLVFAMDDDQAIMDFRGGDPAMILAADGVDEVLAQSFRVPPAVHAVAQSWIEQCSSRFPKAYQPRQPDPARPDPTPEHSRGWAQRAGFALGDAGLVDAIEGDLEEGASVMVIASCAYMLGPTLAELRTRGIPFHNPYRPGEPAWNPMGRPARGMSTAERIARFMIMDERVLGERARLWTGDDVRAWTGLISFKAAAMARGAERAIDALTAGQVPFEHLAALFRTDEAGETALSRATEPDLEWLAEVIAASKVKSTAYPLQVGRSQGASGLFGLPGLVLGTVHSVKGAQADVVYVAPDLSAAGMRQWQGTAHTRDSTRRLFYVAMTRAYQRLSVLAPVGPTAVNPAELIPAELEQRR